MKAVLVIDIPETIRTKYLNKDLIVQLWDKDDEHYIMHDICELKPMPQREKANEGSYGVIGMVDTAWTQGFNDCLSEITGETE